MSKPSKAVPVMKDGKEYSQFAARIPVELHKRVRIHCVQNDIAISDFVLSAFEDELKKKSAISSG